MNAPLQHAYIPYSRVEQLRQARQILRQEADALSDIAARLDSRFCEAVDLLAACTGTAIVTGMGKAGIIGRKITATLSSTGTRALFLHPAEAVHGDLGAVRGDDLFLMLSNSGETEEVCRLLPIVRGWGNPIIAITGRESSTLARNADIVISFGGLAEAGQLGLAPTTSTTAMLAVGDALALVTSQQKGFTPQQFAVFHPAGSLGRQLQTVRDVMREGDQLRIASEQASIREVFAGMQRPGRRTGAVMLVDDAGRLTGLFTDSDLARLLEARRDAQLDRPICEVMTRDPFTIPVSAALIEAVTVLANRRVSELPVIDSSGRPVGLIDITDIIGLLPSGTEDS